MVEPVNSNALNFVLGLYQVGGLCQKLPSIILGKDYLLLLGQFSTPTARGPEDREKVRHKGLPGVAGGG
jgi:hypothetical protein